MAKSDVLGEEKKCLKNDIFGDREGNTYFCPNDLSEYTECCEKDREFTCCEKTEEKNGYEQGLLWGTIAAVVLLMVLVCFCIKKDVNCCTSDRWIFYKYTPSGKEEKRKQFVDKMGKEKQQSTDNNGFVFDEDLNMSEI
ncbi:hypothetical protein LOTGIDRAFT_169507 [Lottia gigantea]|uniref:Uncharacterized protein n=1 Tax=Lottia gigantea TaxID=225164 RepID=V3ZGJ5_LOTGI|nr:hypothetical protein LOTGIDRAFT_169507 [Lottia gigantea]ESO83287.1 hypothetical protein LOTGIDRAFT_169507 [Lottia gigantea]